MTATIRRRRGGKSNTKEKKKLEFRDHTVRNKFELEVLKNIYHHLRRNSKTKVEYETELLPYVVESRYNPDFIVKRPDGTVTYIEAKGRFDYADQRKMKAVRKCYPDLDIRILFQYNGKLRKGGKMTYGDWADKNGFDWAVGQIPKEWVTNSD